MLRQTVKNHLGRPFYTRRLLRGRGAVVVICYHDLRRRDDPPNWLRVPEEVFDRHLSALASLGRFIGPDELDEPGDDLRFLLTFDDGYRNVLRLALPILRRHGAPAVVFPCSAHLESGGMFWFDRVSAPMLLSDAEQVDLSSFGLGVFPLRRDGPAILWRDINQVLAAIKTVGNEDHPRVQAIVETMERRHADILERVRNLYRPLTRDELATLVADPLVHLGSHCHDHVILTHLDRPALVEQLTRSRDILEQISPGPLAGLSYPNGFYDEAARAAVIEAGYRRAFTLDRLPVRRDGDPFTTPRMLVGGYDSPETLRYLINRALARSFWSA